MEPQPNSEQSSPRILVTLCTYNERENLPLLIPEILEQLPAANILVIDDNSPDGTGRLADGMAAADARIHVLHRAGKLGLGTATLAGMSWAIDRQYDYVLNVDADFSHHPRHLPAIVAGMEQADVVIGSRYVPGGGVQGWGWHRYVMSWSINCYARWCLWLTPRDCSGAYRCYRVAKLRELDFTRVRARGYAVQEEILYRCRRIGCRMLETPIVFEDRRYGQSKINWKETVSALIVIFRLGVESWLGVPVRRNPQ